MEKLFLDKPVDKSILWDGTTIPIESWDSLFSKLSFTLTKGEKRSIPVFLNNIEYEAKLTYVNVQGTRKIIQLRYNPSSALSNKLREIYPISTKVLVDKENIPYQNDLNTIQFYVNDHDQIIIKCFPQSTDTIRREEINMDNGNDILTFYMKEMKSKYPQFKSYQDYHLFTLLCMKFYFFSERSFDFDPDNILQYLTDGSNDGGIDAIFNDPNSEDNDVIVIQSKYYNSTSLKSEDVIGELYKINETLKDLQNNRVSKYNENLVSAYRNATGQKGDNGEIRIYFFTSYAPKTTRETTKLIRTSNKFLENYSVELNFKNDIEQQIQLCENDSSYVESGKLKLDKVNNYLEYEDSVIVNVSALDLQKLQNIKGNALLGKNLRYFVRNKNVDTAIDQTISKEPDNFWYKNNGIVIICDDYYFDGIYIKLEKFSIINGGQTTYKIGRSDIEKDFYLQCKVIKSKGSSEKEKDNFAYEIAESTNSQKPIKKADLKANSPEQLRLKQRLKHENVYYLTKKGEKVPKQFSEPHQSATLEQIGKIGLAAIVQQPGSARSNPQKMFNEQVYFNIFGDQVEAGVLADLLKIQEYYRQFLKTDLSRFDKQEVLPIIKNGLTYQLACITLLFKLENNVFSYDTLGRYFNDSDELKQVLKNMGDMKYLIKHNYDNEKEMFFDIFSAIGAEVLGYCFSNASQKALENQTTISAANYLKLDSNYYREIIKRLWYIYKSNKTLNSNIKLLAHK